MARPITSDLDAVNAALLRARQRPTVPLSDVALILGTHIQTLTNAANQGKLGFPSMRAGVRWIVPTAPLLAFLGQEPLESTDVRELTSA